MNGVVHSEAVCCPGALSLVAFGMPEDVGGDEGGADEEVGVDEEVGAAGLQAAAGCTMLSGTVPWF